MTVARTRQMSRWIASAATTLVFGGTAGCSEPRDTLELVVSLRTDLSPVQEFDTVHLSLFSLGANSVAKRHSVSVEENAFVPARTIAELGDLQFGDYRLDVQLEDASRDRLIAKRPVLLTVATNTAVTVPISRSCVNVACPPKDNPATPEDEAKQTACFGGRCVDPRCTAENRAACGMDAACDEAKNTERGNEDCATGAECATGECSLGICWAKPKARDAAAACNATQWCDPERGCVDVEQNPPAEALPSCIDGMRNGTETSIDCGGDCDACVNTTAPQCDDGVLNGNETGTDCGGDCDACRFSPVVDRSCRDGAQSGEEEGIDCGGICTPCPGSLEFPSDIDFDCAAQTDIPVHQCLALVAFYVEMDGSLWDSQTGWLSPMSMCTWEGITCAGGAVTRVEFADNNLVGSLLPVIGNLSSLEALTIEDTAIHGSIPSEIGLLTNLETIRLQRTALSGTLPSELGELSNLKELWLAENAFNGPIPAELGSLNNLEELWLSSNGFGGNIPATLGNLSNLKRLALNRNMLIGAIPSEIGNLSSLEWLWLNQNQLTGSIPAELGQLSELVRLNLFTNQLSGTIPVELAQLTNVASIFLNENQLRGDVPAVLMDLPRLNTIRIDRNACLYATSCGSFLTWLNSEDPDWRSTNTDSGCTPPPGTCP